MSGGHETIARKDAEGDKRQKGDELERNRSMAAMEPGAWAPVASPDIAGSRPERGKVVAHVD
jgi:hypothetical protein